VLASHRDVPPRPPPTRHRPKGAVIHPSYPPCQTLASYGASRRRLLASSDTIAPLPVRTPFSLQLPAKRSTWSQLLHACSGLLCPRVHSRGLLGHGLLLPILARPRGWMTKLIPTNYLLRSSRRWRLTVPSTAGASTFSLSLSRSLRMMRLSKLPPQAQRLHGGGGGCRHIPRHVHHRLCRARRRTLPLLCILRFSPLSVVCEHLVWLTRFGIL
jgi:hypothetical protein